jgi:hypothetical protein
VYIYEQVDSLGETLRKNLMGLGSVLLKPDYLVAEMLKRPVEFTLRAIRNIVIS